MQDYKFCSPHHALREKKNILITICIPSFNRKEHVKGTLLDILSGVEADPSVKEVIFVDDGYESRDLDEILSCVKEHSKFRYYRTGTTGSFGHVFLECINSSETDYVLITYDDDILFTKNLQELNAVCNQNSDYAIFVPVWLSTSNRYLRGSSKKIHKVSGRKILRYLAHAPGICYKKPALEKNFTTILRQRLKSKCAFAEMYPQVLIAALLDDGGGKILSTPIQIGKDGAVLPTEIKTTTGESYYTLRARLHQYLALMDLNDKKIIRSPIIKHLRINFLARIMLEHTDLIVLSAFTFYVRRHIITSFRILKHRLKRLIIGSR